MLKIDEAGGAATNAESMLDRIATALGCPVSAFFKPPSRNPNETDEMLRLWSMIGHEQDRAKVLAFIENAVTSRALKETPK